MSIEETQERELNETSVTPDGSARQRFDRIYHTLRSRICLHDYPPGERLREEDIALEFGISRTPVRQVLVKLETEGLLRSVHGVGTIVTDIDVEELAQVYQLRVELAEMIGKLSPMQPDEERPDQAGDRARGPDHRHHAVGMGRPMGQRTGHAE